MCFLPGSRRFSRHQTVVDMLNLMPVRILSAYIEISSTNSMHPVSGIRVQNPVSVPFYFDLRILDILHNCLTSKGKSVVPTITVVFGSILSAFSRRMSTDFVSVCIGVPDGRR